MASTKSTGSKSTSKWGSFLTGLESKLDTILGDEDPAASRAASKDGGTKDQPAKKEAVVPLPAASTRGNSPSRPSSTSRAQDRLNERLAKAMAGRNLARKGESSLVSSGVPSRTASPATVIESPRASLDVKAEDIKSEQEKMPEQTTVNGLENEDGIYTPSEPSNEPTMSLPITTIDQLRTSTDSRSSASARPSLELIRSTSNEFESPELDGTEQDSISKMPEEYKQIIEQMQSDYETSELQRQEETHDYLERIDALQSKLQYLTKEAAEIAKSAASESKPGSDEQKLALKDEKIALLIEEGQKLAQTELKHMSIIKKLRAKSTEDDKFLGNTKKSLEKYEKIAREAQERAKRVEAAERRAVDKNKTLPKIEKELESIKNDRDAKASLVRDLQLQLSDAVSLVKEEEGKAQAEALEAERRITAELRDVISGLKTERDSVKRQHQSEIRDLKDKIERDKERARIAEIERQGEQSVLESRLESLRTRVEEASAGTSGDLQVKLLRQIETLQNQYAIASENWQGIEGSLLARVTALEKERDEIAKREGDIRRKARETNMKLRRVEEELESAAARADDMAHELHQQKSQVTSLNEKLARSEADVAEARRELIIEREARESRQAQRAEDDKARQAEESARTPESPYQAFRAEPSITYNRTRKDSHEREASSRSRRPHGLGLIGTGHTSYNERPVSRRSSTQPLQSSEFRPPSRQESFPFVPQLSINDGVPETPSQADNQEDFFDGVRTPATPDRTINDMISGSTAGAGPSVQLVERMSAAVRRLESEKAASKDELVRLSAQRDEAREQVFSLIKEAEGKRAADERIKVLEKEVKIVEKRASDLEEMLGEKLEREEELKADVQDLKQICRDLMETLK